MIPLEHSKFQLCVKLSKGHRAIEYLVQTEERRDIDSITWSFEPDKTQRPPAPKN